MARAKSDVGARTEHDAARDDSPVVGDLRSDFVLTMNSGRLTVLLRNETDASVRIPGALLAPALAFEVTAEDGARPSPGPATSTCSDGPAWTQALLQNDDFQPVRYAPGYAPHGHL